MDTLSRIRLSHTEHLLRLALKKKFDNQCRLAAILDRAEPVLERFEQFFLSSMNKSTLQEQLIERRDMVNNQGMEEYVIVNEQGEPIQLPSSSQIVHGNAIRYGEYS